MIGPIPASRWQSRRGTDTHLHGVQNGLVKVLGDVLVLADHEKAARTTGGLPTGHQPEHPVAVGTAADAGVGNVQAKVGAQREELEKRKVKLGLLARQISSDSNNGFPSYCHRDLCVNLRYIMYIIENVRLTFTSMLVTQRR